MANHEQNHPEAKQENRLLPGPNTVRMRLYGQGLGDCFLLAFPRADGDSPCYLVIDCGCAKGTPDEKGRMRAVVADIVAATGGTIDVLAITHQHYDHVIGFRHALDLWQGLTVKTLWLPWTEIPGDADAAKVQQKRQSLNDATAKALARAQDPAAQKLGFGVGDDGTLRAEAGFLGIDLGAAADGERAGGFSVIQDAFAKALALPENGNTVYCEPGDVLRLPGSDFHAFVLGPPRDPALINLLVDEAEMYHYADIGMAPDGAAGGHVARAFRLQADSESEGLAAALGATAAPSGAGDRFCPFDSSVRLDWDRAMLLPFFDRHYRGDQEWRCVDDDWLDGASTLGLQAGNYTNNISLVLAFEMPRSKRILLFPGDAQVGNWVSWHRLSQWRPRGGADTPRTAPDMNDLLGRVAFYKVGHHGSHNATIKDRGLERMPDGFLAYIPVSVPIAHDVMGYCPMPFYPVVRRLQTKTGGRVFLSNGELVHPLPPGANEAALRTGVVPAPEAKNLPAMELNGIPLEGPVPLYLEVTLDDPA